MALGDLWFFDQTLKYIMQGKASPFNFGATPHVIKAALINNTVTPSRTTPDPHFAGTGITDLSVGEQYGGLIPQGGHEWTNPNIRDSGTTFYMEAHDGFPPSFEGDYAGSPTDCWWVIVYDDTTANKNCICYIDLGGSYNLDQTLGFIDIRMNELTRIWVPDA